jgi:ribosome-binding factor A
MPENASHIDDLLRKAAERDAEVSARASASGFAGDPDPYRSRDEEPGADADGSPGANGAEVGADVRDETSSGPAR